MDTEKHGRIHRIMTPSSKEVSDTLQSIGAAERDPNHPRSIARAAVAQHRRGTAINHRYDFNSAPLESRRVIYNMIVRFSRRVWWSKLLR